MKCTNHPETEAIGVCTNCGKAICSICSMEIDHKLMCKSCIEQKMNNKADVSDKNADSSDVFKHPDIAVGATLVIVLLIATIYLAANNDQYYMCAGIVFILSVIAVIYDINRLKKAKK